MYNDKAWLNGLTRGDENILRQKNRHSEYKKFFYKTVVRPETMYVTEC